MAKPPPTYADRKFAMVPHAKGIGQVVAEILGADEIKPDEVRARRWDTADKKFGSTVGLKRTQIIGEVLAGDRRLADIARWCEGQIADFHDKEEKRKAERNKGKTQTAAASED